MKFQAFVLVMAGVVSCVDMKPVEALRRLLMLDDMLDNYKVGDTSLGKRAASCSLLCCHKKKFEGICAKCRGVCGGGDDHDDYDTDGQDEKPKKHHHKGADDDFDHGFSGGGDDKDDKGGFSGKGGWGGGWGGNGGSGGQGSWGGSWGGGRGAVAFRVTRGLGKRTVAVEEAAGRAARGVL
ncbi:hypothetical protein GQ602_006910 [Ophiocordyceps camponoti-floridani]|uniref:Uncharacterized protein n=1 Tax=Ophiocordyceps camponoti-floridani TaxID=2030778 RepID=A0A8H4VBC8_9HYPO|nr:hypothetical protein GQ602_006910 [Ophiocordyceps camponoti-floridani]